MAKIWCVGGRQYSESVNQNIYQKLFPKTKKLVKVIKSYCKICGCKNHKISLSKRHKEKSLRKMQNASTVINMQ